MATTKVALAGATGNLGPSILKALLAANFSVTVLTRKGSKSTSNLEPDPNLTIREVDYLSIPSLTDALAGINVVISNLPMPTPTSQKPLIDSSVAAGVQRFIPSEFGSVLDTPKARALPIFEGKVKTQDYAKSVAAENPNWSYTSVASAAFFDWGLRIPFILDLKGHKGQLFDGGDRRISTTTVTTIGKAMVGIINNLPATRNRTVKIHDTAISQNEIIAIAKSIDGKEWETTVMPTSQCEDVYKAELAKPEPNLEVVAFNQLWCAAFGQGWDNKYTENDNALLGLKEMTQDEVREVIRGILQE